MFFYKNKVEQMWQRLTPARELFVEPKLLRLSTAQVIGLDIFLGPNITIEKVLLNLHLLNVLFAKMDLGV